MSVSTFKIVVILHVMYTIAVCDISGRPIDYAYVKSSWSMSNFQNAYIMHREVYVK
jgi:hypothetical protein